MVDLVERPRTTEAPAGYREAELGILPENWGVARLGDIAPPSRKAIDPLEFPDEEFDYYAIPAYRETGKPALELGRNIRSIKTVVNDDAVLFGKLNPRVPKVWRVDFRSPRRKIASTEFIALAPLREVVDSRFLYYMSWSDYVMRRAQGFVSGSTPSRQRVDLAAFLDLPVPIPPLPEQRAIAHVLSTVQRAREATEAVIAAMRELKSSLMRYLFTYGPVPVDRAGETHNRASPIGTLPDHWEVRRLADIATLLSGGTPSKRRPDWWHGPVPWASPKDLKIPMLSDTEDHISQEAADQGSRIVPPGTLFVVVRGMILAKDVPVALTGVAMAFNQDLKAIRPLTGVLPEYLLHALQFYKGRLARDIGTSAHGTRRIGTTALEEFLVPLPPIHEQQQIADALASVDAKLVAEATALAALDSLAGSLLESLMTGQLRTVGSAS